MGVITDQTGVVAQVTAAGELHVATSGVGTGVDVTASTGNLAATAGTATLPAAAAKTTYISGFEITGAGATAASVVSITVTGVLGGTLTYLLAVPAGAAVGVTPLSVQFSRPLPASAVNTAIVVNLPSFGTGNTNACAVAHGFQL